jgi:hypothetical protein
MNPATNPGPLAGGNAFQLPPIWYPPVASKWIFTGLIVFAGSVAERFGPHIRTVFTHPIGFFLTAVAGIAIFQLGFPPGAFAVFYFLLMMWATQISSKEGYLNASNTIDWVTNSKRWYVEKVLKERPVAIQEKDVATYPVEGASAQGSTNGSS